MDNRFQTIRLLSAIMDKECPDDDDKAYFSSNIFAVQYQLVKRKKDVTHVPNISYSECTPELYSSQLYENPIRIALFIYINVVLRKLPLGTVLIYSMAKHLILELEVSSHNLCQD